MAIPIQIRGGTTAEWAAANPVIAERMLCAEKISDGSWKFKIGDGVKTWSELPYFTQGVKGDAGPANTLTLGTVTTGAAGTSASATITGTSPNQTLNLTIPRGNVGNAGAAGAAATITVGTVTTGAAGTSAVVTNSGTTSAAVLDFTIPKGDTGTGTPTGSVLDFAGSSAPTGWLIADGSAISRTTYADLFAVIGTTYGAGNGSSTFNLPDLRGRVPVGRNSGTFGTLGATGGAETVTLDTTQIPSHAHANTASTDSQGGHSHTVTVSGGAHTHILPMAASGGASGVNDVPLRASGAADFAFRTNFEASGSGYNSSSGTHTHSTSVSTNGAHTHTVTMNNAAAGGGQAHNNLQPYIVLNKIIKT